MSFSLPQHKKNIMRKLLYPIIIMLILSCNKNSFVNINRLELASNDSVTIKNVPIKKKEISVGDIITNHPLSSQIVEIDGKEKYLLLDLDNIYVFDWNSGTLEDSISLSKTGRLNNYSGFNYISRDSIIVYNYATKSLFLVNREGNIIHHIVSPGIDKESSIYVDIEALNSSRPLYINKNNILSGSIFGNLQDTPNHEERASISCSFENQKRNAFPFPSIYYNANWGGVYMNKVFHCKEDTSIVYSFPIEHNIYKCNSDFSHCDTLYMGSRYITGISECTYSSLQAIIDKELRIKYYISQPSYGPVLYDENKKCYIRIAYHPISNWEGGEYFFQPFSIIVLDKEKSLLMESTIIKDYKVCDLDNLHICNDGLAIAVMSNDENKLCFFCYKY